VRKKARLPLNVRADLPSDDSNSRKQDVIGAAQPSLAAVSCAHSLSLNVASTK